MTSPQEPAPGRSQPPDPNRGPAPEDPREQEPVRDPPIYPDRDDVGVDEINQAGAAPGVDAPTPAPDAVVYDQA